MIVKAAYGTRNSTHLHFCITRLSLGLARIPYLCMPRYVETRGATGPWPTATGSWRGCTHMARFNPPGTWRRRETPAARTCSSCAWADPHRGQVPCIKSSMGCLPGLEPDQQGTSTYWPTHRCRHRNASSLPTCWTPWTAPWGWPRRPSAARPPPPARYLGALPAPRAPASGPPSGPLLSWTAGAPARGRVHGVFCGARQPQYGPRGLLQTCMATTVRVCPLPIWESRDL